MMNEAGAFRATDETLKTSEYVYRKIAEYKLSHMLLMRQMADLAGTPVEHMSGDAVAHHFRPLYTGTLILNVGINANHGAHLISEGAGDLIAFGRDYIATKGSRLMSLVVVDEICFRGYQGTHPLTPRLSGQKIARAEKGFAVALAELLDIIENCREADAPARQHLIENRVERGDGAADARHPDLDPALDCGD
jgi:hypothetical protein